jgi:UPF0755 protein
VTARRFLAFGVAVVLVAAAGALWVQSRLAEPYRGFDAAEVFVEVRSGDGIATIGQRLIAAGVIADAWTFRLAARLAAADRRLQAGEYRLADPASPREVVDRLAAGDIYTRPVTFPEGLTVEQIGEGFEREGLGSRVDFLDAAGNAALAAGWDPDARSLEGYLFPDTYALPRRASAQTTVRAMVTGFEQAFDADLRRAAAERGLTVREVVTLASLIEKETAAAEERTIVSAVYQNRLRIGMPLQCDPTVIYALMLDGRWNGNLRRVDLQFDSPYNTYRYGGLPPGPIAAPGRAALVAAVNPADVPYLYFVSRNDGTHVFASTLAEHNRNVARWQVRYFRER